MTDAGSSLAEALRQQLTEAQKVAAGLQEEARRAADALISNPSRQLQVTRDELVSRAELADLTTARLALDLKQAEQQAIEAQIQELLASQSGIQQRAGEEDDRLWRSLAEHEASLAAQAANRLELRKLNMKLYQLGYRGEALQLAPRPKTNEYRRRVAGLQAQYDKNCHPLMLPVRMGE